jgi:hypothetical protein
MPVKANILNLGRVVGEDGFSPIVTVTEDTQESYRLRIEAVNEIINTPNLRGFSPIITVMENTQESYRLRIETSTDIIDTPNLRGAIMRSTVVEVLDQKPVNIPLSLLQLDPARSYTFFAVPCFEYPLLRHIAAVRYGDSVRITIFTDTLPYTEPQVGNPYTVVFGEPDLIFGNFRICEKTSHKTFPLKLIYFENPVKV